MAHGRKLGRWIAAAAAGLALLVAATPFFWSVARPVFHKDIINRYAAVYKFDPLFVMALVKVESSFQARARSPRGAIGLMQLMPDTAREMAGRLNMGHLDVDDFERPEINIRLGLHYLALLREEFRGDTPAVLAAYNAGPRNVRAWQGQGRLAVDKIPYPETRHFVANVMDTYAWLKKFQKVKNAINA